jgi:transposase
MESDLMRQLVTLMLPSPDVLRLDTLLLDVDHNRVILEVASMQEVLICPGCGLAAGRIHSYYNRTLADLAWADISVCLQLQVRKCYCSNQVCPQQVFMERLPLVAAPWARRTQRLAAQQCALGLALGGVPSARLSSGLACPTSRDTFLRLVRAAPTAVASTPRYLGVDDWALRKGHTYCSIIIDLEHSVVVDILPDRTAATFAEWLREHPGVELISRDRGGAYAEGGTLGAPDAVQVADRWHLLKNLGDALTEVFDQKRAVIEQHLAVAPAVTPQDTSDAATPTVSSPLPPTATAVAPQDAAPDDALAPPGDMPPPSASRSQLSKRQQAAQAQRRQRRLEQYEEVRRLHNQGHTVNAIADQVGLDRNTVRKWLQAPSFPERQPRQSPTGLLEPFKAYVLERWNAGCYHGALLLREIQARGYQGSASHFYAYITQLRKASGLPPKKRQRVQAKPITDPTPRLPSSRTLAVLVLKEQERLDSTEQKRLANLRNADETLATAITLVQEFTVMVRERQPAQLDAWLERTAQSSIAPLVSFGNGVHRDYAAVKTGLTLSFSNGPTEGHINRLKMLKRQMFGRAKLDLLEKRIRARV